MDKFNIKFRETPHIRSYLSLICPNPIMPQPTSRQTITKSIETLTSGVLSNLSQITSHVQSEIG